VRNPFPYLSKACWFDSLIALLTGLIHFSPRFSTIHSFDKPNDETALRLMDASASLMMDQYPDIVFGYGFSNEYRYVILFQITFCGVNELAKRKVDPCFYGRK
jgi:hypothetical protein